MQAEETFKHALAAIYQIAASLQAGDSTRPCSLLDPAVSASSLFAAGAGITALDNTAGLLPDTTSWHDMLQPSLEECPTTSTIFDLDFSLAPDSPGHTLPSPEDYSVDGDQCQDSGNDPTTLLLHLGSRRVDDMEGSEPQQSGSSQTSTEYEDEKEAGETIVCATMRGKHKLKSNQSHKYVERNYRNRLNDGFQKLSDALEGCGHDVGGSARGKARIKVLRKQSKGTLLQLAATRLRNLQRENRLLASELSLLKEMQTNS